MKQGRLPEFRHTYDKESGLRREELFGEESFEGAYSLLYHLNEPTRVKSFKEIRKNEEEKGETSFSHRHLKTNLLKRKGDLLTGKQTIMKNDRVKVQIFKPEESNKNRFYRNAIYEMLFYVHQGSGNLISPLGELKFEKGDYIYAPKGLTFRLEYTEECYFLILQTLDNLEIPKRYLNKYGQLKEGTPYYSRDIQVPELKAPENIKGQYWVSVEFEDVIVEEEHDFSPLDVEGWDGYLYPFTINVENMAPIVGKLHQPPPVHETFSSKSMMVATFLPRKFDFHERSIPISYYHNNIDVDEFLFYSSGNFMSRKGIEPGSVTLHVRGIVHGPQPGAVEEAIGKSATDEVAVMIETYDHLWLTHLGKSIEDKEYPMSWYN